MGFATFHAHKASPHTNHTQALLKRSPTPNPSCSSGGFYKSPTLGSSHDSLKPIQISWDTTCLPSQKLDIHLLAPWYNGETTEMTSWTGITNSDGQTDVTIMPKWWNSTSEVRVQLVIVEAGMPIPMTTLPAGPVWTATYTAPADGSIPASADTTKSDSNTGTIGAEGTTKSLSGGKTAAAVLIPLLVVVGGLVFAYMRWQRKKSAEKSKRFSVMVDKRMSTISADWKSMSAAGAQAAIRNSIAVNRDSSAFAFGAIRPQSTYTNDPNPEDDAYTSPTPQMKQVRTGTGVGLRHPPGAAAFAAERQSRISRVSFADTVNTRPSGESRRTRAMNSTYIPPVPTRSRSEVISGAPSVYPDSELEKPEPVPVVVDDEAASSNGHGTATLSPRQATGPLTLTPEDIRARIHGRSNTPGTTGHEQDEYDEVMPALSLMRTGSPTTRDEYILPQQPPPTYPSPTSAFTISAYQAQSTSPMPASPPAPAQLIMSPDDLLRAYAVRSSSTNTNTNNNNSTPPPMSPKQPTAKGRKLSIRASLGFKKPTISTPISTSPSVSVNTPAPTIGYPMPIAPVSPLPRAHTPTTPTAGAGAGMAGVGLRGAGAAGIAGVGIGMGLAGATYAIGEDDEHAEYGYGEDDAYGGV